MRTERITLAGTTLVIDRPEDPEGLIDEIRFESHEFLPYWAELWPSGLALAEYVAALRLTGRRVLELGCGLALPSFAAALAGAEVLATDWAQEATELVEANAAANALDVEAAVLDWDAPAVHELGLFDLVLAADVLYEARNGRPLLDLLGRAVAVHGEALVADPGRRHAGAFFDAALSSGWTVDQIAAASLPGGAIHRLRPPPGVPVS